MQTKDYVYLAVTLIYIGIVSFQARMLRKNRDLIVVLTAQLQRANEQLTRELWKKIGETS